MKKWIEWFLGSNDLTARLLRTVLESLLGFLIANIDLLFAQFTLPTEVKMLIMGSIVAIVSPILASLGAKTGKELVNEDSETQ